MITLADAAVTEDNRPYQLFGTCEEAYYDRADEIVASGPAGTGKSRMWLEKMHALAERYPRMRALMVRKTRTSLTQTTVVTYEQKVLPPGYLGRYVKFRTQDQHYEYYNGSIIAVGGMDKATKVMSSEYDYIYAPEAIELTIEDYESLTTRLRNGVMSYQQIVTDTNPSSPKHWLKQRADQGVAKMYHTRHEDNPRLYDHATNTWTPEGERYIGKLERLTGVRYKRLRKGLWVAAEGQVYDSYDPAVHLIYEKAIPKTWPRYWAIDWGYRAPCTVQWWAKTPDNELILYREIYQTQTLVEDLAKICLKLSVDEPRPTAIVCDHDTEDRMTFERHTGYATIPAYKDIKQGIEAMQARLKVDERGKSGLYVMRDITVKRDETLVENNQPIGFVEEIEEYVWDTSNGKKIKETPIQDRDHSMDAARYMVAHFDRQPKAPTYAYATRPAPLFSQQNRHV